MKDNINTKELEKDIQSFIDKATKAGITAKEMSAFIDNSLFIAIVKEQAYDHFKEGKNAGIKEVVDWVNNYLPFNEYYKPEWQAKLKEWGIE